MQVFMCICKYIRKICKLYTNLSLTQMMVSSEHSAQCSEDGPWSRALAADCLRKFNLDISIERSSTVSNVLHCHCHLVIAERTSENELERRRKSNVCYGSVVLGIKMKNACSCHNNNNNTNYTCSFGITQTDCNSGSYSR